jgi:hypothetical protein
MMDKIVSSEELRILADIGFIAASRGLFDHATAIFEALKALRPEGEAGYLGHGIIDILRGAPASALTTLQDAPRTDAVYTFMGIAQMQVGNLEEGKRLLRDVCSSAEGTAFARIAAQSLEQAA